MSDLDPILRQIDAWEPDVVAVGVTDADKTLGVHGPTDQRLPIASLTKPLTAYATLIAVHHGLLHLDEPVDVDGAETPFAIRHLLAHASGLPLEADGKIRPPQAHRIYSNWGYDLIGQVVADRAGIPFADFMATELFAPLGMASSQLDGSPARAATSTVDDLLQFAREVLAPSLVAVELVAEATSVAFPGLDGILPAFGRQKPNDWGLGFEIRGTKAPHWLATELPTETFGHFGQSGSFLFIVPEIRSACVSLADKPFGKWAPTAWRPFSREVFLALR